MVVYAGVLVVAWVAWTLVAALVVRAVFASGWGEALRVGALVATAFLTATLLRYGWRYLRP